jgi:hypothetical protein
MLKKIEDDTSWNKNNCTNPEHFPPTHIVLEPGTYEHTCSSCGNIIRFTIPAITF